MSFYSYKNANPVNSPGEIAGSALDGLNERICIQVQRVYDSCLQQEQLDNVDVVIASYAQVVNDCNCNCSGTATANNQHQAIAMRKILCWWSGHKEGVLDQGTNKQRPRASTVVKVVCRSMERGSSGGHVTWVRTSGEGLTCRI